MITDRSFRTCLFFFSSFSWMAGPTTGQQPFHVSSRKRAEEKPFPLRWSSCPAYHPVGSTSRQAGNEEEEAEEALLLLSIFNLIIISCQQFKNNLIVGSRFTTSTPSSSRSEKILHIPGKAAAEELRRKEKRPSDRDLIACRVVERISCLPGN